MNLNQRKSDFISLGNVLNDFLTGNKSVKFPGKIQSSTIKELRARIEDTFHYNACFTLESVQSSLKGIAFMLNEMSMNTWLNNYSIEDEVKNRKNVGSSWLGIFPWLAFMILCVC